MRYPEHIIEEVRRRTDIVDIIGESVQLRRSGKGYIGLCPFHADKKPSMNVNPDLGIFKCFSCGKGGNVFTYVMSKQGLNFIEALKMLADRAGIALPEDEHKDGATNEAYARKEAALKVLQSAGEYYQSMLKHAQGQNTYAYFIRRGFDDDIQNLFGLGYAPDSWTDTLQHLFQSGYTEQALEDAGLILHRERDNSSYDRFRGRAMFPIHDPIGKVVGFGARRMNEDDNQPKYINSPQTIVYDKSKVLYGLSQAKTSIRSLQYAILTEGYADTISLVQAGFSNVVASSGTALTIEQLQLLSRYCKMVYIVYDGDTAGLNAAMRGLELAIESGFDVRLVILPEGEDPDSFVRNRGPESFRRAIKQAISFIDFKIEMFKKQGILNSPSEKAQAIRSLLETVAKVPDALQHDFLIQQISSSMQLSYSQLEKMYDEYRKTRTAIAKQEIAKSHKSVQQSTDIVDAAKDVSEQKTTQKVQATHTALPEEKSILHLALTDEMSLRTLHHKLHITSQAFITDHAGILYNLILETFNNNPNNLPYISLVERHELQEEVRNLLMEIVFGKEQVSAKWTDFNVKFPENIEPRVLMESLAKLRLRHLDRELEYLKFELQEASPEREVELLSRMQIVIQERHDIPNKFHTSKI